MLSMQQFQQFRSELMQMDWNIGATVCYVTAETSSGETMQMLFKEQHYGAILAPAITAEHQNNHTCFQQNL
jgi:hypothetical protein